MEKLRILIIIFSSLFLVHFGYGQNNTDAGIFCDPNLPNGAPILCDLGNLDGFTARMPTVDTNLLKDQPERLCRNGNGNQGDANNLSWFAFVAGSSNISFRIIPSNCTVEGNNLTGVQAGIYSRCYTWDEVVCMGDCMSNAFTIGGDLFTPGETYYFFIDGCNGSVCDYTVEVLRGDQPYPLPDIDSLIFDAGIDTFCTNITTVMTTSGLVQDSIKYTYSINPPTIDYPTGFHPDTLSSSISWTFSEPGDYEICAQATNGCDITPLHCQTIYVRDIPDEIFNTVTLCMEDLGSYRGPDMEDPNGDGIVGWQGDPFFSPGVNRDTIFSSNGCFYIQEIEVVVIPLNTRQNIELVVCGNAFPFDYEGFEVTGPLDNFSVSLENKAASGCDSLISLTVNEVVFEAAILLGDCVNGDAILTLEVSNFPLAGQANTNIVWRDPAGNILPSGSNPLEQPALVSGIYEVEVGVTIDTLICTFLIQSANIDLNNLVPLPPIFVDTDTTLCGENNQVTYRVIGTGDTGESFSWVTPGGANILAQATDSIVIDWGSVAGGNVCATVTNSCGTSEPNCLSITAILEPNPLIIGDSLVCDQETVSFSFSGDPNWNYHWTIQGGNRISMVDSNSNGPHEILPFNNSDMVSVTYWAENLNCESSPLKYEVDLISPIDTPVVFCTSTDNSVLFQWNDVQGANDYQISVLTGNQGTINGNAYLVEGLSRDELVTIAIQAIATIPCANSETVTFTCIAGCDPIEFSISATDTFVCPDVPSVELQVSSSGIPNPSFQISGTGVSGNTFLTEGLEPSVYNVVAALNNDGCLYLDTVAIEIGAYPSFTLDIFQPICEDDQEGDLVFNIDDGSAFYLGNELIDNGISLSPGSYDFEIRGNNGCTSFENVIISNPQIPDVNLLPFYTVEVGSVLNIDLEINNNLDTSRIQNIVWYNDDTGAELCSGDFSSCRTLSFSPDLDLTVCAEVTYDGDCMLLRCTDINVLQTVSIFVPNIFTPDENGDNDEFFFLSNQNDVVVQGFYIFNRWGELMHSRTNFPLESPTSASWDGNYRGKPAAEGVYVYVIEFLEEGVRKIKKGDVTLLR